MTVQPSFVIASYARRMSDEGSYHVAVSFAGEQRPYVDSFVAECRRLGLSVFYDLDKAVDWWGMNVTIELRKVFGGLRTQYVIPFLSKEYLIKPHPMDEYYSIIEQDLRRGGGYILPVKMGDVSIPPQLLNPAIGFLQADGRTPEQLASAVAAKVHMTTRRVAHP
jgi:hypothetical protein